MLAKTGALSLFRWNGGGDGWTERLPSDAELLVHCLACYFDARLLTSASMRLSGTTNPQAEVMKPFTGVHFYRHGEKPGEGKENTLAIVQLGRSPAHYVVQVGSNANTMQIQCKYYANTMLIQCKYNANTMQIQCKYS